MLLIIIEKKKSDNSKVKMKRTEITTIKKKQKLKYKFTHNDLILCNADKGNTITILTKSEYIKKIEKILKE